MNYDKTTKFGSRCPKCGVGTFAKMQYEPASEFNDSVEALHYICGNCGFSVPKVPADAAA